MKGVRLESALAAAAVVDEDDTHPNTKHDGNQVTTTTTKNAYPLRLQPHRIIVIVFSVISQSAIGYERGH